jgi:hypothetical protein
VPTTRRHAKLRRTLRLARREFRPQDSADRGRHPRPTALRQAQCPTQMHSPQLRNAVTAASRSPSALPRQAARTGPRRRLRWKRIACFDQCEVDVESICSISAGIPSVA